MHSITKGNHHTKLTKKDRETIVRQYLSPYWSEAQISAILRKDWKKVHKWGPEDFEFALTLRLLSRKTYNHLRKSKKLPLPGYTTLKKYFQDFQINEGLFDSVMAVLKIHARSLTPKERITCLAFDEVHIRSDISYNPTTDEVIGPHKEANTMMLKLMFKQLKIPIWYRFDTTLDKEELFEIIKKVEDAGYHVKTITCDQGPKNRGLATKLGIKVDVDNPENSVTWFENPARQGSKIFWFFDVPHLYKSLRNNIQEYGCQLPTGAIVTKAEVQGIQSKIAHSNLPSNSKLRKSELYEVSGQDRQRVSYAAEYVSETMAKALRSEYTDPKDANMLELADFFELADGAFDVLNSSSEGKPGKTKERKCGYGKHLDLQEETLRQFRKTVLDVRILSKTNSNKIVEGKEDNTRQPWQIGFAIACTSMLVLYHDLKKEYVDIIFITTTCLNQDAVESLFSILRALGGTDYRFGALSFVYRLRLVVLGAGKDLDIKKANVNIADAKEEFISLVPKVIETVENDTSDEIAYVVADEFAKESSEPTVLVVSVPDDDLIEDIVDFKPSEATEIDSDLDFLSSDSEQEDMGPGKTPKRKKASKGNKKKEAKKPLRFDSVEVFSAKDWVQKRIHKFSSVDAQQLEADALKWDKAFQTFHETASDGKFSLQRKQGVTTEFIKCISSINPNNYCNKLLKQFALDRTFHRMLHMKSQMKEYQREYGQKQSTRAKKIVIDLGEG